MTDRPIIMIGFDRSWQRAFARKLHAQTNGALSLFVAQNTPQKPMVRRVAGALEPLIFSSEFTDSDGRRMPYAQFVQTVSRKWLLCPV